MARVRAIFQPVIDGHDHASELKALMSVPWATEYIVSSAFANSNGVSLVEDILRPLGDSCRAFIGVRNGSTTGQALSALLETGIRVYALDTAMRARIFHPKLYMAKGLDKAQILIGSANLTYAGMFNNIEAGLNVELDLKDENDCAVVELYESGFQRLINDFPEHCFQISGGRQIVELMREGVLEDERNPKTATAMGAGKQGSYTSKPRIGLPFTAPPSRPRAKRSPAPATIPAIAMSVMPQYGVLLWAKLNLPISDLQQLTNGNNPGVLRLTQAGFQINGQRINKAAYFRYTVFASLVWAIDPNDPGKEMANVAISLVIAGVYVGDFDLHVSHKPAWAAGQANYTTGLHWDGAVDHIRKPGLIGRTLRLFAPSMPSGRFVIEID